MEKFKLNFIKGRSFKRGAELGTAMLVGSGLSALGGLGSGFIGSAAARSNNEQTMAFNREMQQRAFDYQTQMYERQIKDQENLYNKYQSPQAIAEQLKAIGLNTSVLAGKGLSGGSMPSVPSPASVSVPQISGLENEGVYFDKALDTTTKAISNLSQASFNDARSEATRAKLEFEIEKLIAEKDGQELLNAYQTTQNALQSEFGREKIGTELRELHSRIIANYCRGEYDLAAKDCQDALTLLYEQQHKMNDEKFGQVMLNLYAEYQLTQSKIKTEASIQNLNYASADYQKALSKTEDALRGGRVELQTLSGDLMTLDKYMRGNDLKLSDETLQARVFGTIEQMYREGLISENVFKEGQILSVKRDWESRQQFGVYLNNVVSAASSALNAYSNYRGVSVNRLNAKERNEIQGKFVDEYVRQSKSMSNAKRSAVLGPDYEMYSDQFFGR